MKVAHFRQYLEQKWHDLYRVAYSWCQDSHLSCDLVQDALTKALKNHHQLRDEKSVNSWLFTILANCWRDHCRGRQNMIDIEDVTLSHDCDPELENSHSQALLQVRRAIARLHLDQRQVLSLVVLECMPYEEVAKILGIPVGTVMSRLCRARRNLRQLVDETATSPDSSTKNLRRVK
jgi:RNA polymerase sigma-70 factor (ECF subfamily)